MATTALPFGHRLEWTNHFMNIANAVDRNVRQDCDLNITQGRILFYVATHEVMTIGNVGSALFLKASTVTAAVNVLVKRGFIKRIHDDEVDRRNVYIAATEEGVAVTPSFIPLMRRVFVEEVPDVRPERVEKLRELLLPASSRIFFDTEAESFADIAQRVAGMVGLDCSQEEVVAHISRVLVVEAICYFLSKLSEFDSKVGLAPNEARILRELGNDNSGLKLKEISALLNIRSNVASMSIRTLEDAELIVRGRDREDRRAAKVTLDAKGERIIKEHANEFCELFDQCWPGLSSYATNEFLIV
ncbi:MAG: MarR family winged helix-turn-helix transcriptional regulator [Coriobacteriales bacterium]